MRRCNSSVVIDMNGDIGGGVLYVAANTKRELCVS